MVTSRSLCTQQKITKPEHNQPPEQVQRMRPSQLWVAGMG
jgi:hypothetical protein